ncbi:hypothetical protein HOL21_04905 [Candidatus Woesearchaeota archaeon]|jgi:hypothetical protein|nr:hypothetical protein [Candidatus Woesearchaeota archaeon]MBT5397526.1 hypothetical protein [Candidatus Woesearchaeota archaeon]MBT5924734.1 hypothetical protein [Candidatus Woesearchaeota archaeon]MBT6367901.1 hypothetical protein [Candidatus Woesearchaeota archaeon]MBT7763125.1 hypothetical protein [Candidatus Woesearchaeota archaeon]
MTLTTQEKAVVKALVEKELADIKKLGDSFDIVNSPFLSSISRTKDMDIEFLKTETLYIKFLEDLIQKL